MRTNLYFYSDILRAVERSEHDNVDTLASLLPGVNDIYFEAEEVLDQTIDENVWKPYVEPIEVGDIVCARSGYDSKQHFRVLGVHGDHLWIRNLEDQSTYAGCLVGAAKYRKVGEGDD